MRKIILSLLSFAIVLSGITMITYGQKGYASAQAEIAMELSTGRILTEGNAHARLPMASTTKILTAIIIIEDCNLDEEITVPDKAVGVEGSSIYLQKDEKIDIRDLLYGLMLRSGNDSATALALHHSGSIEKFAEVMNERAKKMGAEHSHFKNPSGLPDDEHYTTAYDLCTIACYAMKNETFREIVSTTNYTGKYKNFVNKNKMLYKYKSANGIKTGYTVKAGRCLVSSAEQNGMDIVCVVLN
ncbi:MAG: D-alanyl-D-alanine carboxypeptidase, partial [Clostridia bacterium]|nr:D-alanyl-D-alanine carboxypeptidase [Clostridia bacterium]